MLARFQPATPSLIENGPARLIPEIEDHSKRKVNWPPQFQMPDITLLGSSGRDGFRRCFNGLKESALPAFARALAYERLFARWSTLYPEDAAIGLMTLTIDSIGFEGALDGWFKGFPHVTNPFQVITNLGPEMKGYALRALCVATAREGASFESFVKLMENNIGEFDVSISSLKHTWFLAQEDPLSEQSLAKIAAETDPHLRAKVLKSLSHRIIGGWDDLERFINSADDTISTEERDAFLRRALAYMASEEPDKVLNHLLEQRMGLSLDEVADGLVGSLAPLMAPEDFLLRPEIEANPRLKARILSQWAQQSPDQAATWIGQTEDLKVIRDIVLEADQLPEEFWREIPAQLLTATHSAEVAAAATRSLFYDLDMQHIGDWLTQFKEDAPREAALLTWTKIASANDPLDVVEHLLGENSYAHDTALQSKVNKLLVANWALHDPSATLEWIDQNGHDDDLVKNALSSAIQGGENPSLITELSLDWLNRSQAEHEAKSQVATEMITSLVKDFGAIDSANGYVQSLEDVSLQNSILETLGKTWVEHDPVSASEWIADSSTPPDIRNRIIEHLVRNIPDDPERTFQWATTIEGEPTLRADLIHYAEQEWERMDPRSFKASSELRTVWSNSR